MSAEPSWAKALEKAVGSAPMSVRSVAGGDIAASHHVILEDGRPLFVKHYADVEIVADAPPIAEAEARGLDWLAEAEAIRVARPVAHGDDWLALEWIESATAARDHDERLGRGLALLHRSHPDSFGFEQSNWIGRLPWPNTARTDWPTFYAEQRLAPLARRARDEGRLRGDVSRALDELIAALPTLAASDEPPARLHGDLWSGNAIVDERGAPCLIDPAVYGGHREIDLAMMRLFGGFGPRVFTAYEETYPLEDGALARVPLYEVLPLLVHVCLFGRSYAERLARAIDEASHP